MKKKKMMFTVLAVAGALTLTAAAAGVTRIEAELRPDIRVMVGGREQLMKDDSGKKLSPITYNEEVYLPVEALEDALEQDVVWNEKDNTVVITERKTVFAEETTVEKQDYQARIDALSTEADALVSQADKVKDRDGYREFNAAEETFDRKADKLEKELEKAYRAGELTREEYRSLDRSLEQAEDKVDDLDDAIERRLGLDDDRDDDWDDDDWDDDWDD